MLTPMELKSKQVVTTKRKYDKNAMDEFLAEVYANYQELYEKNSELKKNVKTLSDGVQYYRSIETTLQQALILAEKTSNETKDAALLKAEAIEKDAHARAKQIIGEAENEYNVIKQQSAHLMQQFNQYKMQLKRAASAQLELVNSDSFEIFSKELNAIYQMETPVLEQSQEDSVPQKIDDDLSESEMPTEAFPEITNVQEIKIQPSIDIPEPTVSAVENTTYLESDVPPLNELHPNIESGDTIQVPVKQVKEALALEPSISNVSAPLEAEIKPQTANTNNQSLDSLLKDLNMNNKKNKKEEDPFEFLGSVDDF